MNVHHPDRHCRAAPNNHFQRAHGDIFNFLVLSNIFNLQQYKIKIKNRKAEIITFEKLEPEIFWHFCCISDTNCWLSITGCQLIFCQPNVGFIYFEELWKRTTKTAVILIRGATKFTWFLFQFISFQSSFLFCSFHFSPHKPSSRIKMQFGYLHTDVRWQSFLQVHQ